RRVGQLRDVAVIRVPDHQRDLLFGQSAVEREDCHEDGHPDRYRYPEQTIAHDTQIGALLESLGRVRIAITGNVAKTVCGPAQFSTISMLSDQLLRRDRRKLSNGRFDARSMSSVPPKTRPTDSEIPVSRYFRQSVLPRPRTMRQKDALM